MKRIPDTDELIARLKPDFVSRYKELLGNNYEEFIQCSFSFLRRSLRVNTLKIDVENCKKRLEKNWKLRQVPWCKEGFWIESERRDIGNTVEHALGYIYVQEAASMIPPLVLEPQPGETVLDMAAAPGSKTSQMAAMMQNKGILVANDIKPDRLKPLGLNLQRCGITNTVMTIGFGQRFKEPIFDRILIDAPCSGTGNIRRSLKTVEIWNPSMIKRLAH
ncbi:MAG: tRNA methyltransferase, partial [Nanoarchaeota archaeon]